MTVTKPAAKPAVEAKADSKKEDVPLTVDTIDYTDRAQITSIWPAYVQGQLQQGRGKVVSKTINLELYHMKKPLSAEYLVRDSPLVIEQNQKYALVGDAGSGKSVFFRELAAGTIRDFPKHIQVHHCHEIDLMEKPLSVIETVVQGHEFRTILLAQRNKIDSLIKADPAPDAATMTKLKDQRDYIEMFCVKNGVDTAYERAAKMLRVLGFDEFGQSKSTNDLSGGLRMRVALCRAFFIEADLLLLDEPNNHLDFPSMLWLENRLRAYRGSYIMVCHDRHLVNGVCRAVMCIEDKKINVYPYGFAEFEKRREVSNKKKSEEIDKFLIKNRNVDSASPLAKEKAEKQAWNEAYQVRLVQLAGKFTFPDSRPLECDDPSIPAKDVPIVSLKDVTFSYDVKTGIWIFKDPISCTITASSRFGLMGPNGAGKSTLLKLITDRLKPVTGDAYRHPTATVAYFAQHTVMDLDLEKTAIEYMLDNFPNEKGGLLRNHLSKVGLTGQKAETRMKDLSHGLRSCIVFAKITYVCPHLLIMDEPTNFLDLDSVDSLITATNKYKGALILVSHNRSFLLKCAEKYLSVVPGKFDMFDDLKTCERATYQFIEEMESGGKVSTGNLVRNNPSADAANSVREEDAKQKADAQAAGPAGVKVMSLSSMAAKPRAAAPAATVAVAAENEVGKKCTAIWSADGARYPAVITKVIDADTYEVNFTGYNEKGTCKRKDIQWAAAPVKSQAPPQSAAAQEKHHGQKPPAHQNDGRNHPRQQQQTRQTQQSGAPRK